MAREKYFVKNNPQKKNLHEPRQNRETSFKNTTCAFESKHPVVSKNARETLCHFVAMDVKREFILTLHVREDNN